MSHKVRRELSHHLTPTLSCKEREGERILFVRLPLRLRSPLLPGEGKGEVIR